MKIKMLKAKLPQDLQIINPKAAQSIKGGNANSNTGADADPVVIDIVGGS